MNKKVDYTCLFFVVNLTAVVGKFGFSIQDSSYFHCFTYLLVAAIADYTELRKLLLDNIYHGPS